MKFNLFADNECASVVYSSSHNEIKDASRQAEYEASHVRSALGKVKGWFQIFGVFVAEGVFSAQRSYSSYVGNSLHGNLKEKYLSYVKSLRFVAGEIIKW